MSYDLEHVEKECPCPCGKGRIVYGSGTNDWNQVRDGMIEIWCPECYSKYKFSDGGLLPKDYPDYAGDEKANEERHHLWDIIANYRGMVGIRYWGEELRKKRIHLYLTDEELKEDRENNNSNNLSMALGFCKRLADDYSLKELADAQRQMKACKASTQLTGVAKQIAQNYKRSYGSIKVSNVIVSVNMAVRNYQHYKDADREDEEYIEQLKTRLKEVEAIYFKDFKEYEEERKKHLIPYELKDKAI